MSTFTIRFLVLLTIFRLFAVDVTVCAVGCTYSNLQTALNATTNCSIDTVTVKAGEVFNGSYSTPFRDGCGIVNLRTSRYAELPPVGTRVGPEHTALMPTINANIVNSPALTFFAREANDMTAVDTVTNVMTVATSIPDGLPFSCSTTPPPPMVAGTVYFSKYISPTTMQASLTPGGPAIDLTGVGSTGSGIYNDRPHCIEIRPRRNWRVTGIRFTMTSGTTMQNALVRIGGRESHPLAVPSGIWFDRSIVQGHGDMSADFPTGGIEFHGSDITISGNHISGIRCFSCEGKPLLGWNITGPVLIENNYLEGGSIGFLIGGSRSMIPDLQSNNVVIRKNYFVKPGKEFYQSGSGAPTGSCYYRAGSGAFYLNAALGGTSCSLSGRCYVCQPNNTWAISTTEPWRSDDFLQKNGGEIKECNNCLLEGNIFEGQQASIDSQGNCLLAVVGATAMPTMYIRNLTIRNNRCIDTWGGISTATYSSVTPESYNWYVYNNLTTGMGSPQLIAANLGTGDVIFQAIRIPKITNTRYFNNTSIPDSSASVTSAQGAYVEDDKTGLPSYTIPASFMENNIWWGGTAGARTATGISTCNSTANGWGTVFANDGSKQVRNNVQFGTVTGLGGLNLCATTQNLTATTQVAVNFAADYSLNPTSPYSASCSSGCSYAGTDGGDLGVDIPRLRAALSGVKEGKDIGLRVEANASRAVAFYTAPSNSACSIYLYPKSTPATYHPDTDIVGEQTDSRTGSITDGRLRQVVLGYNTGLTANTWYRFVVSCGTSYGFAEFRTKAVNSGGKAFVRHSTSIPAEYSASPLMTSPTAIPASTLHTIPLSGVVYYKPQSRTIRVFLEN